MYGAPATQQTWCASRNIQKWGDGGCDGISAQLAAFGGIMSATWWQISAGAAALELAWLRLEHWNQGGTVFVTAFFSTHVTFQGGMRWGGEIMPFGTCTHMGIGWALVTFLRICIRLTSRMCLARDVLRYVIGVWAWGSQSHTTMGSYVTNVFCWRCYVTSCGLGQYGSYWLVSGIEKYVDY